MKISTAYDAWWFLHDHPKMQCREAILVSDEEKATLVLDKGERVRKVKDEMPWLKDKTYWLHEFGTIIQRHAIDCNLGIHWAKVSSNGRIEDDAKKNTFIECWLEFGEVKQVVSQGSLRLSHYHDYRLDCGAPTFDQALVKLARLVKRHYGDYTQKWSKA